MYTFKKNQEKRTPNKLNRLKFLQLFILFTLFGVFIGCTENRDVADIYGEFETTEITVSSEMPGKIMYLKVEEGDELKKGEPVGLLDTAGLHLKMNTLEASMSVVKAKLQRVAPNIAALVVQRDYLADEVSRLEKLVKGAAAPEAKLDELKSKYNTVEKQIEAAKTKISDANRAILANLRPLRAQREELKYQLSKAKIINPIDGKVLAVFHRNGEVVAPGLPLYKIGYLKEMFLRGYITESQLPLITLGQKVKVDFDVGKDTIRQLDGVVTWIADEAEFTPRTIQTKEERVNKVYAIKVKVRNEEGLIKIGMPGEIRLK